MDHLDSTRNSSFSGVGCRVGPCGSNSVGTMASIDATAEFGLASPFGTATFLGAVFSNTTKRLSTCWRKQGWLLTLGLLSLTVSAQVGLSRADNSTTGACDSNNQCPTSDQCCSSGFYCGTDDTYCGVGCLSGPCYRSSGGQALGTGPIVGIVVGAVVVGLVILGISILAVSRRRRPRNRKEQNFDGARDGRLAITEIITRRCRRFTFEELNLATRGFKDKLGEGGFGVVYKGTLEDHNGKDIMVAIKELKASPRIMNEFEGEVSTLGSINQTNLVQLLGFTQRVTDDKEQLFLVYEFVANNTLDYWIFNRADTGYALPWITRINILKGMVRALFYLHKELQGGNAVVHLDIKPENILLTESFVCKIADFGLSKLLGSETTRETHAAGGSRGYMAPEILLGAPVSPKMDVYSFGMVLLEVVSGRKHVDYFSAPESVYLPAWAIRKIYQDEPLDIVDPLLRDGEVAVDASEVIRLVRIGLLCLQRDPNRRPEMSDIVKFVVERVDPPDLPSSLQSELESNERHFRPDLIEDPTEDNAQSQPMLSSRRTLSGR